MGNSALIPLFFQYYSSIIKKHFYAGGYFTVSGEAIMLPLYAVKMI
jgi:hypothetical protein